MFFSRLSFLLALVSTTLSAPTISKRSASGKNVVYWGQNGGGELLFLPFQISQSFLIF